MLPFFKITTQKTSIAALDGVRAVACFTVIFYHINVITQDKHIHIWTQDMIGPLASSVAFAGWCGVTLFFVLSGFLLFMPYARAILFDAAWPDWKRYYIRRIFRIWPGYFVSLAFIILWFHPGYLQPQHRLDLALFLTFFMDSTRQTYQALNGPFWTLAVEWQFYMILPLLALAFCCVVRSCSLRYRTRVLILCIGVVALWGVLTRAWGRNWVLHPQQPLLLPQVVHNIAFFLFYGQNGKCLEDFAVGMFISVCYVLSHEKGRKSSVGTLLRRYSEWLWGFGILWLFFMGTWFILPPIRTLLQPWIGERAVFSDFGFALGYGCCIMALLSGSSYLRRPLEWGPLRWLGQLSYGLYIWHLPLLLWLIPTLTILTRHWPRRILAYSLYWACIACIVIPFCYLFYLLIERPGINLGVKLLQKKAHRPTTELRVSSAKRFDVDLQYEDWRDLFKANGHTPSKKK